MLKKTSKDFKTLFLLKFTSELIKHSAKSQIKLGLTPPSQRWTRGLPSQKIHSNLQPPTTRKIPLKRQILTIPEPRLPPNLQYLKPTPTNKNIDLNKLNPLIQDPLVKSVECSGPDKNIIVRGTMGVKKTRIILNKDEVNDMINRFSEAAKIPIHEGVFKVAFGQLVLTAIVSEVIGSKFIINKMMYNPHPILRR